MKTLNEVGIGQLIADQEAHIQFLEENDWGYSAIATAKLNLKSNMKTQMHYCGDKPYIICSCCKAPVGLSYDQKLQDKLISKRLCFYCNFWDERATEVTDYRKFISNGYLFSIPSKPISFSKNKDYLGHGGRCFKVTFPDAVIYTNNLWGGGDVPPIWQECFEGALLEEVSQKELEDSVEKC